MVRIRVRSEQPGDYPAIDNVVAQAFGRESEARLVAALRDSSGFSAELSLVALLEDQVIGHILFSSIIVRSQEGPASRALALAPLSVAPRWQRQGIGKQLVWAGLEACGQKGPVAVIVVGHPEYYPQFGFQPARSRGLEAPFPVRDAAFMAVMVESGNKSSTWPPALQGLVEYPAPFGIV